MEEKMDLEKPIKESKVYTFWTYGKNDTDINLNFRAIDDDDAKKIGFNYFLEHYTHGKIVDKNENLIIRWGATTTAPLYT